MADSKSAASVVVAAESAPAVDGRMATVMSDRMSEAMTMTRTIGRDICSCVEFPDLGAVVPPEFFVFVSGKKDQ